MKQSEIHELERLKQLFATVGCDGSQLTRMHNLSTKERVEVDTLVGQLQKGLARKATRL